MNVQIRVVAINSKKNETMRVMLNWQFHLLQSTYLRGQKLALQRGCGYLQVAMMTATWLALLTLSKRIYTLLIGPHALQICGGCHVTDRDLIPNVQYLLLRGKYSTTVHTCKQKYSTASIYLPQISLKSTKTLRHKNIHVF